MSFYDLDLFLLDQSGILYSKMEDMLPKTFFNTMEPPTEEAVNMMVSNVNSMIMLLGGNTDAPDIRHDLG